MIRPYLDRDFDEYAETLLKTWPCGDIEEARKNAATAVKRAKENKRTEIWVADVQGRAVGFMLIEFTRVCGHKGESFMAEYLGIDWLDVHPDFQCKGIGKELLHKAEERARDNGLNHLFMHTEVKNLVMLNLAAKNGFKFMRYLKEFRGKRTENAFLLVKDL